MTKQSRSIQRRIAAQKGLSAPDFSSRERELKEKIKDAITEWQYGARINSSLASVILTLIKEAGYRLPAGKAPLLTDEEIYKALFPQVSDEALVVLASAVNEEDRRLAQAQNDADNDFYECKVPLQKWELQPVKEVR